MLAFHEERTKAFLAASQVDGQCRLEMIVVELGEVHHVDRAFPFAHVVPVVHVLRAGASDLFVRHTPHAVHARLLARVPHATRAARADREEVVLGEVCGAYPPLLDGMNHRIIPRCSSKN